MGPMKTTLKHPDAQIQVNELPNGRKRISVRPLNKSIFVARECCETSYSVELVQQILDVKGPGYLCDEIMRDEDPLYAQNTLSRSILGYVDESSFDDRRILDFGCGSGASTMILARMFPKTQIVGIELERKLLAIAELRAQHYGFRNIKFILSPSGDQLPEQVGHFDFAILNAVYEHLLPNEREVIVPQIWSFIKPGGIMFICGTPHRYFPLEGHTTGLPLINYLPDRVALTIARRFSKRVENDVTWETLLRRGIRGATEGEITTIIKKRCRDTPIVLEPSGLGLQDKIDLWYAISSPARLVTVKRVLKIALKVIEFISGVTLVPSLSLAIKKEEKC